MRVKDGRGVGVCLFVSQFICLLLLLFLLMNYASKRVQAMCAHEREREGGGGNYGYSEVYFRGERKALSFVTYKAASPFVHFWDTQTKLFNSFSSDLQQTLDQRAASSARPRTCRVWPPHSTNGRGSTPWRQHISWATHALQAVRREQRGDNSRRRLHTIDLWPVGHANYNPLLLVSYKMSVVMKQVSISSTTSCKILLFASYDFF